MDNMTEFIFEQTVQKFAVDHPDVYKLVSLSYLVYLTVVYADFYSDGESGEQVSYFDIVRLFDGYRKVFIGFDDFNDRLKVISQPLVTKIFNFTLIANPDCGTIIKDNTPRYKRNNRYPTARVKSKKYP